MNKRSLFENRRGFSRILEVVIAAVIIFISFAVATFLVQTSDVRILQERTELDRLGYNVLNSLANSRTIEVLENDSAYENWTIMDKETYLKTTIQSYLPITVYFNLTISKYVDKAIFVQFEQFTSATNMPVDQAKTSTEVSATEMPYTSKNGNVYCTVLLLIRAGG